MTYTTPLPTLTTADAHTIRLAEGRQTYALAKRNRHIKTLYRWVGTNVAMPISGDDLARTGQQAPTRTI